MLLEIKNLRIDYEGVEAVRGVDISLDKGEIVTILGANGAGKSSVLRAVSGLVRPSTGQIEFSGERLDTLAPHKIVERGIAHVPEGRRLFGLMSVKHNLLMGAFTRPRGPERDAMLEDVLKRFPILREKLPALASTLSGGQQQMVAIGRALMAKPTVILMDEPTLGLAPIIIQEIAAIIRSLKDLGHSILLVEQNAFLALELADRGYVLETGEVALEGEAKSLLSNDYIRKVYLGG